eukprot:m.4262 g.4262  ORF g.4262 m.4262 type:complete len:310 (-) comp2402_c0_seq1:26-955(-)
MTALFVTVIAASFASSFASAAFLAAPAVARTTVPEPSFPNSKPGVGYGTIFESDFFMRFPRLGPVIDHKHKIIMCSIPKNACTQWRALILRMQGDPQWDAGAGVVHTNFFDLPRLSDLSLAGANQLWSDPSYRRVVVVRHPVDRLISAYVNKFVDVRPTFGELLYGRNNITFDDFLTNILSVERTCHSLQTHLPQRLMNEHWLPQTCFCGLDHLRYDYVIPYEDTPKFVGDLVKDGVLPREMVDNGFPGRDFKPSSFQQYEMPVSPATYWAQTLPRLRKYLNKESTQHIEMIYHNDMQHFGMASLVPEM